MVALQNKTFQREAAKDCEHVQDCRKKDTLITDKEISKAIFQVKKLSKNSCFRKVKGIR